jgi:hypothetical protein
VVHTRTDTHKLKNRYTQAKAVSMPPPPPDSDDDDDGDDDDDDDDDNRYRIRLHPGADPTDDSLDPEMKIEDLLTPEQIAARNARKAADSEADWAFMLAIEPETD